MNTVWDIPVRLPELRLSKAACARALALLGSIIIVSTFISGFGSSGATRRMV